jgi:hypothetical protein
MPFGPGCCIAPRAIREIPGGPYHRSAAIERMVFTLLIRSELKKEGAMSPTEFAARMIAADQRFEQALKHDDIRDMRAALAEKTKLLAAYFAATRDRARDDSEDARSGRGLTADSALPR